MTLLYYFGCIDITGHYLWASEQRKLWDFDLIPWGIAIDGKLCPPDDPKNGQPQGPAALHHKDGWTALAFWDRSVDRRSGSNSAFIADSILPFVQMVKIAREKYPSVWLRLPFDVIDAGRAALASEEKGHD